MSPPMKSLVRMVTAAIGTGATCGVAVILIGRFFCFLAGANVPHEGLAVTAGIVASAACIAALAVLAP